MEIMRVFTAITVGFSETVRNIFTVKAPEVCLVATWLQVCKYLAVENPGNPTAGIGNGQLNSEFSHEKLRFIGIYRNI